MAVFNELEDRGLAAAETGSADTIGVSHISSDVYREAPINESNPDEVEKRDKLRAVTFSLFYGAPEERAAHGSHCFPFQMLSLECVATMPDGLRASYEAELAVALDTRSGRVVRPYIPAGIVEPLEV